MKATLRLTSLTLLFLLTLLHVSNQREIKRIVKKVYLHRSFYYGKTFRKLISKQFRRFDHSYVKLFKEKTRCIKERQEDPPAAELLCLGANFKKVRQRFQMITLRIKSIFDNMLQIFFNDNCMNNVVLHEVCKELWDDLKVLDYYELETPEIIYENKEKYIDENFTPHEFERIFKILRYMLKRFKKYMDDRDSVQLVLLGRLFNYLEQKTRAFRSEDHESIVSNPVDFNIDQEKFGLMFQNKLEEEFRDPNNPLVDPDSSLEEQVEAVSKPSFADYFGAFIKPSNKKKGNFINPMKEKQEMKKAVKKEKIEIEKTKDNYLIDESSLEIAKKLHEERANH